MSFSIGETVGRYRITSQLGQGGMATVYEAYDANLDRYVAIKVMHQAFKEDPTFLARFQREAQIIARLKHPHIVSIHEFEEHEGQPYLVMEFVKGETLKARLNKQTLTLEETVKTLNAVGEALTYAHEEGVLHRDIKPSNILLDQNGTPYLTDFGLARMVQAGESTLSKDMLLGTPQYISPEQAQGIRDLGPETDIYSLGIVLYLLVVGRVPYSADTPYAIVHDHIYTPLPMPSENNPSVTPEVERVLLKSLAKEPGDRFHSAKELASAFEEAVKVDQLEELSPQSVVAAQIVQTSPAPPSPALPGVPTPASGSIPLSTMQARLQRNRTLWMLSGFGVFICTCLLSLVVALGAIADPTLRIEANALPTIEAATAQPDQIIEIPIVTVAEAEQLVEQNPNDPITQFTLALALLTNEQRLDALAPLRLGTDLAEDDAALLSIAGRQVAETGYRLEAAALFIQAAELSNEPELRNELGTLLYSVALDANRQQATVLRRLVANTDKAALNALSGRALITIDQLSLAEEILLSALEQDDTLPETHLILGELYLAQDQVTEALAEWRFASTMRDSPAWVIERADELLAEHSS
ncbi:protein kinase [Chloroflexota bacterium]